MFNSRTTWGFNRFRPGQHFNIKKRKTNDSTNRNKRIFSVLIAELIFQKLWQICVFCYKLELLFQNNFNDLDPSYKMNLDP